MTDLSKTVRVEVTAADIDAGEPYANSACPVALALNRAMPVTGGWAVTRARVGRHWVGVAEMRMTGVEIRMSQAVGEFTRRFDDHEPVRPFAFRVWR